MPYAPTGRRVTKHNRRASLVRRLLRGGLFGLLGGAGMLSATTASADEVLSGDYVQLRVNDTGGLFHFNESLRYDATGSGSFGSPTRAWYTYYDAFNVEYNGANYGYSVEGSLFGFSSNTPATLQAPGTGGFDHSATWTGTISGVLELNHVYGLKTGDRRFQVTTTIAALGNVNDVKFAHRFIPYASTTNLNTRGNATLGLAASDFVSSQAGGTGPTVAYFTDSAVTHNAGIVQFTDFDPDAYLNSTATSETSINAIGLGFDVGDLLLGQVIVMDYWIAFGDDPNDFIFSTPSALAARGQTFNQISLGSFLDAQDGTSNQQLQDIITELNSLDDVSTLAALDSMSGAIYGSLPAANFQHTSFYLSQIASRLRNKMVPYGSAAYGDVAIVDPASSSRAAEMKQREIALVSFARGEATESVASGGDCDASCGSCDCLPCCGCSVWTGWITGYGLGGDAQSDGNADGFRYGLGGTQFGLEKQVSDCTTLGLWGNMAWSNVRGDVLDESADIENYHFGAHFTSLEDEAYWIGIAGAGYDHYDVRRQMNILAPVTAEGDMNGWQANAYLERGLTLEANCWTVQPYLALQYIYLHQDEFVETGAGALNLDIEDLDAHSLRSVLGGRFSKSLCTANGRLFTPEVRAAWLHEFLDTNQVVNSNIGGIGGAGFAVRGVDLGRDWATLGTGFNVQMNDAVRLFAGYDIQFNDNQTFHVGSGGVEFVW